MTEAGTQCWVYLLVGPYLLPSNEVIRSKDWRLLEVMDCRVFTLLLSERIQKANGNFFRKPLLWRRIKKWGLSLRPFIYLLFDIKVQNTLIVKPPGNACVSCLTSWAQLVALLEYCACISECHLLIFGQFLIFEIYVFIYFLKLRCNSHSIVFISLKCTVQWL